MSWNEIKVYLAPIGSEVRIDRNLSVDGTETARSTVVTVYLPLAIDPRPVRRDVIELWFEQAGFRAVNIKLQSSQYEWQDVSAQIVTERGLLASISLTFSAAADLCERALIWDMMVRQLCEKNFLQLINLGNGLEPATEFLKHVERSFAWGYFIEMEKWRKFA